MLLRCSLFCGNPNTQSLAENLLSQIEGLELSPDAEVALVDEEYLKKNRGQLRRSGLRNSDLKLVLIWSSQKPKKSSLNPEFSGYLSLESEPALWHSALQCIALGATVMPRGLFESALRRPVAENGNYPVRATLDIGTDSRNPTLTARESEILGKLSAGKSSQEIANETGLSIGTVRSHSRNIHRKLGTKTRRQSVAKGIEMGLLPSSDPASPSSS